MRGQEIAYDIKRLTVYVVGYLINVLSSILYQKLSVPLFFLPQLDKLFLLVKWTVLSVWAIEILGEKKVTYFIF